MTLLKAPPLKTDITLSLSVSIHPSISPSTTSIVSHAQHTEHVHAVLEFERAHHLHGRVGDVGGIEGLRSDGSHGSHDGRGVVEVSGGGGWDDLLLLGHVDGGYLLETRLHQVLWEHVSGGERKNN